MSRFVEPIRLLLAILGHISGGIICGLALIPSGLLISSVWKWASNTSNGLPGVMLLCISIGLGYFLFCYSLLLLLIVFRYLFRFGGQEGTHPIPSPALFNYMAYSWAFVLAEHLCLPLFKGTPLMVWFCRGMGAKIGRNAIITTTHTYYWDMIEMGDACLVGAYVAISGHVGEKGRLVSNKIKIGNNVSIGENTTILAGAVIEDNIVIGANSLVPKNAHLEANAIYAGVPVRRISAYNGIAGDRHLTTLSYI